MGSFSGENPPQQLQTKIGCSNNFHMMLFQQAKIYKIISSINQNSTTIKLSMIIKFMQVRHFNQLN